MSDYEHQEPPCEDCGEVHNAFSRFLGSVSDTVFGARFIAAEGSKLTLGGTELRVTAVGIRYDDGDVTFFALALDDELADALELPASVCQPCADEQADEILRHVDLDAPLPFMTDDTKKEQ